MMRGMASTLEKHHRVQLLDEALEAAVKLSHRYIPARQLPDKSVSLLDTACARVAISQHAMPAEVEDCQRRIEALRDRARDHRPREGRRHRRRPTARRRPTRSSPRRRRGSTSSRRAGRTRRRWSIRSSSCAPSCAAAPARSKAPSSKLEAAADAAATSRSGEPPRQPPLRRAPSARKLLAELQELQASWQQLQGESPLILPTVDDQAVASVVADWTGIPVGRMVKNEIETVLKLADTLEPARHRPEATRCEMIAKPHPDLARRPRQPEQADRRVHARRHRRASARPRPRWRWPKRSTAASRTSSRST